MRSNPIITNRVDRVNRICGFIGALFITVPSHSEAGTSSIPYSHGDPTNYEQYQLELINTARANPSAEAARLGIDLNQGLTAGAIGSDPKQPLAFHPLLLQTARGHSDWMLSTNTFSHTGLNGSTPTQRATGNRYDSSVAENIAYRSTSGTPNLKSYSLGTHENLFKSSSHRPNLMDPSFSVVGLGLREGFFYDKEKNANLNTLMVTQNFSSGGASIDSGPFLVGVVYYDQNENGFYDPSEGLQGIRVEPSYGAYHAITSASGGYAVPLPSYETVSDAVQIDLDIEESNKELIRSYEQTYRTEKINNTELINIQVTFTEGVLNQKIQTEVALRKPTRINYNFTGANNRTFVNTMVSSLNVKADLKVSLPGITSDLSTISIAQKKVMPRYTITTNELDPENRARG